MYSNERVFLNFVLKDIVKVTRALNFGRLTLELGYSLKSGALQIRVAILIVI